MPTLKRVYIERMPDGDYLVIDNKMKWPVRFILKYKFHFMTPRLTLEFLGGNKRTFVHHTNAFKSLHSALVHSSARQM